MPFDILVAGLLSADHLIHVLGNTGWIAGSGTFHSVIACYLVIHILYLEFIAMFASASLCLILVQSGEADPVVVRDENA